MNPYPLPPIKLSLPRDTTQNIVSGTDSFRRASRELLQNKVDTQFNNFGGNRANIEKKMRKIWKADKGYKICHADQSGAEALIVAYLCRPGKYRALFKNGIKPHTYLALKLFKEQWCEHISRDKVELACVTKIQELKSLPFWPELSSLIADSDNWPSSKRFYHFAKKVIHASSYGMGVNTFVLNMLKESEGDIVLSKTQGKEFLNGFNQEFPEISEWRVRTVDKARKEKVLRNIFGHPYNITDFVPEDVEQNKDLIAWVPQSSVAEITRTAFVQLYQYIEKEKKDWHQLFDTHDSYDAESPEEEIMDLAKVMKSLLEQEFKSPYDGEPFKMRSGLSIGYNFAPYHKESNPLGLQDIKL